LVRVKPPDAAVIYDEPATWTRSRKQIRYRQLTFEKDCSRPGDRLDGPNALVEMGNQQSAGQKRASFERETFFG
jgi:hypothetical protein